MLYNTMQNTNDAKHTAHMTVVTVTVTQACLVVK